MKLASSEFNWTIWKIAISAVTGLPDDALHILSGMVVLTVAAFALRRPPSDWRPWMITLLVETVNEIYDLTQTTFPTDEGNFRASLHDFWLTLLWPTLIMLIYPHLIKLEHEAGPLAAVRRLWHERQFRIGFAGAVLVGLLASIYLW